MINRIILSKFTKEDFSRLISWVRDEKMLIQFAGTLFSYPLDNKQLNNYISMPNMHIYKVLMGDDVIGHAELNNFNTSTARISRILIGDENNRNKGYGKIIISKLLNEGFQKLNVCTIELFVLSNNYSAQRCYEHCLFEKKEEVQINAQFYDINSMFRMEISKECWRESL